MTISLHAISDEELQRLALPLAPAGLVSEAARQALPPPFVARRSLEQMADGAWGGQVCNFYMVRDADGCIVGACGFKYPPHDGRVEIGYAVAPCCRQQGIATAAIAQLSALAFDLLGVQQVLAEIDPANLASQGVVRKLGFQYGGMVLDRDKDSVMHWVLQRA